MSSAVDRIAEATRILEAFGLPRQQLNDRSALCLLALVNLGPEEKWANASAPLLGITPIMKWVEEHYLRRYAPNTRETFRRYSMHQFMAAGIAVANADHSARSTNSPKTVYQIEPNALSVIRMYGTGEWDTALAQFVAERELLVDRYARRRSRAMVPVTLPSGATLELSPGKHNVLIRAIIESFAPNFVPGADLLYVGDTGDKTAFADEAGFAGIGVALDLRGKMPDVILLDRMKGWLVLTEAVTSHGPVDGKRHEELKRLFMPSGLGLIYVTAFPDRRTMARYLSEIAWETEVWSADAPTHLIHFNGERFLGPY